MLKCKYCGHLNEPIFKYCIKCGRELPRGEESKRAEAERRPGFYLYPIRPDGKVGSPFSLKEGSNRIGKAGDAEISFADDPWIAPVHSIIEIKDDMAVLSDAGSRYGTYVRIRGERSLGNGEYFRIGYALFKLELPWPEPVIGPDDTPWLGTPAYDDQVFGRVVRVGVEDTEIAAYLLTKLSVKIGRKEGKIRLSNDPIVSGIHAEILPSTKEKVILRDLGSLNGTYYRLSARYQLSDGDYLLIGGKLVLFRRIMEG